MYNVAIGTWVANGCDVALNGLGTELDLFNDIKYSGKSVRRI